MQKLPPKVIIIGGGLAGMAAAVALECAGARVTLLESRASLGGRAGSFIDPQTGEKLDNCQHVLLGCCTNLIDFYQRLGVADRITWERSINFVSPTGKQFGLWGMKGLPAPLNLGASLAGFDALSVSERSALVRAMLAMMRMGRSGREALADVSFGDWLDEHHQPDSLFRHFYDPVIVSGLNEDTRRASAAYAIQIFQDAMLANARGYLMGLPNCPLEQLYRALPCANVRLGARVARLRFDPSGVTGVDMIDGESISADAVILATNYHAALRWVPDEWLARDERFHGLSKLESVPILGAHLWFDRPVLRTSHVAFMEGPLHWLFRKDNDGRSVHGVISAARDWITRSKEDCLALFEEQVRRTLRQAASAKLLRGVIVIEKRATFSPLPGIDRLRPQQSPPPAGIQNLYLAGDYTRTGWPATMEGAVRSGYLAADAVIRNASKQDAPQASFLVPDLPPQWLARIFGLRSNHASSSLTASTRS
jgi:squalene-associated FAD-dependent desaturase